jgi:hypothetical protein
MKKIVLLLCFLPVMAANAASHHSGGSSYHRSSSSRAHKSSSDVHVHSYTKRNGEHVQSHMRTAPDSTKVNNFSARGNVNPYTGKVGTKDPNAPGH